MYCARIARKFILRNTKTRKGKRLVVTTSKRSFSIYRGHRNFRLSRKSKAFSGTRVICLTTSKRSFSTYRIHPAVGIARLGDSLGYYDEPTVIGGLPTHPGTNTEVKKFRDESINRGLLRQASVFNIYDENGNKIDMDTEGISEIQWSVWLANKKGAFYEFAELQGNPLLSPYWWNPAHPEANSNSYEALGTPKRNAHVEDQNRQKLIIDFGPRTCSTADHVEDRFKKFNPETAGEYQFVSHPSKYVHATGDSEKETWKGNASDITSFGHMHVSEDGQLRIVPAHGATCGKTAIDSFAGGSLWWDDICDGPVRAVIKFEDDEKEDVTLTAWCMIGSPKYAPELVNISTMDDVTYDAAVRYNCEFRNSVMVDDELKFNLGSTGFKPIFSRDIKPILERMKGYNWVANVDAMVAFANPPFNVSTSDPLIIASEMDKREYWFSLLRQAFPLQDRTVLYPLSESDAPRQVLFADQDESGVNADLHFPLMPLNSGDNSVMDNVSDTDGDGEADHSKQIISKFATVTPTQYYFLYQWAHGHVNPEGSEQDTQSLLCNPSYNINDLDRASGGNCVGYPTSPGVETTWNIRVPWIYEPEDPYRLLFDPELFEDLFDTGLTPLRDECTIASVTTLPKLASKKLPVGRNIQKNKRTLSVSRKNTKNSKTETNNVEILGVGLEPGDLTKRMAIPWQADYSNCSYQTINFTDPNIVRDVTKPAYYAYWWPPQAPWNVYLGYEEKDQQEAQGWGRFNEGGSGEKVYYQRGILEHTDVYTHMIDNWQHLGFIVNGSGSKDYPYFVEQERNHKAFELPSSSSSDSGDSDGDDGK